MLLTKVTPKWDQTESLALAEATLTTGDKGAGVIYGDSDGGPGTTQGRRWDERMQRSFSFCFYELKIYFKKYIEMTVKGIILCSLIKLI